MILSRHFKVRPLFEGWCPPNNDAGLTERGFIDIFITNLVDLAVCFKDNPPQEFPYQMALLDHGQYTRVSPLARVGDAVCSLIDGEACFAFRFRKWRQLDADENRIIQQDFEQHGAFRNLYETPIRKVQHVELVGFCVEAKPFQFSHGEERLKPRIFAIH